MKFGGRTVTTIIRFSEDTILLIKRGTVVFKGYWALPGGRVDACMRKLRSFFYSLRARDGLDYHAYRMKGSTAIVSSTKIKVPVTAIVIRETIFSPTLRPRMLFNEMLNIRPPSRG